MTTDRTPADKLQAERIRAALSGNSELRRYTLARCIVSTARMASDLMEMCQAAAQLTDIPPDISESMAYVEKRIGDEFYRQLGCELTEA